MKWTIKTVILVSLLAILPVLEAERQNFTYTLTAGTPVRLASQKTIVSRLFIQNIPMSGGGVTIIMLGVPVATACDSTNTAQVTAYLGPSTSTTPGQSFSDPQGANGNTPSDPEDMQFACLDTTITGTKVTVSFWRRN